jgi:predicted nucleic acid-binding protein
LNVAYVDTSCLVAIAFGERGSARVLARLESFERLFAANLLEAELMASFTREGVEYDSGLIADLTWILPDRPLTSEIERVLSVGYIRGADLWHLATALYVAEDASEMTFVTLDAAQRMQAERLGFLL